MTINTTMDLGSPTNPKRPTNRIINIAPTKGVTVVNMSGEALRKHSEVIELRRIASKYRKDLNDAMNALSIANLEIERLSKLSSSVDCMQSEINRLHGENKRLEEENASLKELVVKLGDKIKTLESQSVSPRRRRKNHVIDDANEDQNVMPCTPNEEEQK